MILIILMMSYGVLKGIIYNPVILKKRVWNPIAIEKNYLLPFESKKIINERIETIEGLKQKDFFYHTIQTSPFR